MWIGRIKTMYLCAVSKGCMDITWSNHGASVGVTHLTDQRHRLTSKSILEIVGGPKGVGIFYGSYEKSICVQKEYLGERGSDGGSSFHWVRSLPCRLSCGLEERGGRGGEMRGG